MSHRHRHPDEDHDDAKAVDLVAELVTNKEFYMVTSESHEIARLKGGGIAVTSTAIGLGKVFAEAEEAARALVTRFGTKKETP